MLRTHQTVKKAETFGQHFSSKCSLGDQDFLIGVFPKIRRRTDQHIHTVHFRVAAVKAALRKLVPSKATVQDGIPARVEECASELALPLSKLFTLSFVTGVCPAAWKIAMVVLVHEKKARSDPKNYRPVSLLPVMSKVMESLINRSLTSFLERQKVLSQHQFGFRRGLGRSDLLTKLHSEWSKAAGLGLCLRASCRHSRSIRQSVAHWRPSPSSLLRSHRRSPDLAEELLAGPPAQSCGQRPGVPPPLCPVQAGVPQGSILGPTLFLLYVNSCEDVVPDGVKLAVYADDTTLYQALRTEATILQSRSLLQAAVDAAFAWGAAWKIRFQPSKSQTLIIDHHRPAWTVPPICFGGRPDNEESEIKLLCVTFDTHLTFNSHIRAVTLRANSRLHLLRRPATILSPRHRETMYKGFVRPLLEYAPLVRMGSSTTSLAQLDRVQRCSLHVISEHTWLPSLSLASLPSLCYHISVQAPLPRPVLTAPLHYSAQSGPDPQHPLHAILQLRCPPPPPNFSCRVIFLLLLAPACIVLFLLGSSPSGIPSHLLSWTILRHSPICRHSRLASSASSGITTGYGLLTHSNQPAPCVAPPRPYPNSAL